MSVTDRFGNSLRFFRQKNGWSQDDLAKMMDTTKQVISNYENSKRSPNIYVAADFARVLGVSLQDMLGMGDEPDDRLEALHQNPKLGLLFDRQKNMSEADIDFMIQVADRIVKENYGE